MEMDMAVALGAIGYLWHPAIGEFALVALRVPCPPAVPRARKRSAVSAHVARMSQGKREHCNSRALASLAAATLPGSRRAVEPRTERSGQASLRTAIEASRAALADLARAA